MDHLHFHWFDAEVRREHKRLFGTESARKLRLWMNGHAPRALVSYGEVGSPAVMQQVIIGTPSPVRRAAAAGTPSSLAPAFGLAGTPPSAARNGGVSSGQQQGQQQGLRAAGSGGGVGAMGAGSSRGGSASAEPGVPRPSQSPSTQRPKRTAAAAAAASQGGKAKRRRTKGGAAL